jgi:hypothetical protein
MTIELSIEADLEDAIKGLTKLEREQVPYATAVALTRTAKDSQADVAEQMRRVFDRPTPYTLSATYIKPATKQNLRAEVFIKDIAFKATPAIQWLSPQIYGGTRPSKRFEKLLMSRGILPMGMFAIPASGARLDRYGNMSAGQIIQILSALGASRDPLANRNKAGKRRGKRRGGEYFAVSRPTKGLAPGVYERIGLGFGSAIRPVLVFAGAPVYTKLLPFYETIERTTATKFQPEFVEAFNRAIGGNSLSIETI